MRFDKGRGDSQPWTATTHHLPSFSQLFWGRIPVQLDTPEYVPVFYMKRPPV